MAAHGPSPRPEESDARRAFHAWLEADLRGEDPDPTAFARALQPESHAEFERIVADYDLLRGKFRSAKTGLAAGRVFGDYRLFQEIGCGGMGVVWEAEQLSLGRRVALKLLYPHYGWSPKLLERFRREASSAARLRHPSVVAVYEIGEQDGFHFIAQELVPGGLTLADAIDEVRESGTRPPRYWEETAARFIVLAEALHEAHSCGVIHRDVKPGNVLVDPRGRPMLADFGLALMVDEAAISRTGDVSGTPYYMSPEQAGGRRLEVDHRTDVFSLGSTLYEALTLERPFRGENAREVIEQILLTDPVDPRRTRARVPRDLALVCLRCLEKRPDNRYATMDEVAQDLRRFLEHRPIHARPPALAGRMIRWTRRHPAYAVGGFLTVTMLVAVSVLLVRSERDLNAKKGALDLVLLTTRSDGLEPTESVKERRTLAGAMWKAGRDSADESGGIQLMTNAGRMLAELGAVREARGYLREACGASARRPQSEWGDRLDTLAATAWVAEEMDSFPEVHALCSEGLRLCEEHASDLRASGYLRFFRNRLFQDALRQEDASEYEKLEARFGTAPDLMESDCKTAAQDKDSAEYLQALSDQAHLLFLDKQYDEAEKEYRLLVQCRLRRFGSLDRVVLSDRLHLAEAIARQQGSRLSDAERELRNLLGDLEHAVPKDDPLLYKTMWRLGANLIDQRRHAEAEGWYMSAESGLEQAYGPEHLDVLDLRTGIVILWGELKVPGAEEEARVLLDDFRRWYVPDHSSTLIAERALAGVLMQFECWEQAEPVAVHSYEALRRTLGRLDKMTLEGRPFVIECYLHTGKLVQAEAAMREQLADQREAQFDLAGALGDLGAFLADHGTPPEACQDLEEARSCLTDESLVNCRRMRENSRTLAKVYRELGRTDEAREMLRDAAIWSAIVAD